MNQILVTDRLYVTNKLKKKKKMYKIQFVLSILFVFIFSGWYIYSEVQKNACEAFVKSISAKRGWVLNASATII